MRISVAMATYNGEAYLKEQLDSIMIQLNKDDEVIISDDGSNDGTCEMIKSYMEKDERIRFYRNTRKGIISNFENAILHTKNDIIFLADQDDVWTSDKVIKFKELFIKENPVLILSNYYIVDEKLVVRGQKNIDIKALGVFQTIKKNQYIGASIAFQRKLISEALPFPEKIPMHDMWLGLIASYKFKVKILSDNTLYYRRHSKTATNFKGASLGKKVKWRIDLVKSFFHWKLT